MRKFLSYFFLVVLTFSILLNGLEPTSVFADDVQSAADSASSQVDWPSGPSVFAETAVLIDASTGTVLYDKSCNKKMYPASITKIMTALLTIENCDLNDTITYSDYAVTSISSGEDANIGCQIGEKMKVKDALYALMLSSANEVATALGEHIAGSIDAFADMMNKRAKEAGAKNTHFANANGLHNENHYVTAYDMAMITRAAAEYDVFNQIVNTVSYTIPTNNKRKEKFQSVQRHKMVSPYQSVYYDGIIGGKTGYTDQARTTLVTYAKRKGMTLICVVLHSDGAHVYSDTTSLLDFGFNNFNLLNISKNVDSIQESKKQLKSPFGDTITSISLDDEAVVIVPKGTSFKSLTSNIAFVKDVNSFATVTYAFGDKEVGSAKVQYKIKNNGFTAKTTTNEEKETAAVSPQKSFKLPSYLIPLLAVIIAFIIVLVFVIKQKRKINFIRAQKRQRNRNI